MLVYHVVKNVETGTVKLVVVTLLPAAVVNWNAAWVISREVEKPMMVMVMTPAPRAARTLVITGTPLAMRTVRVRAQLQATVAPPACKVVVNVMVPETVPV